MELNALVCARAQRNTTQSLRLYVVLNSLFTIRSNLTIHIVWHGLWFFAHLFVDTTARRYNYQFAKLPSTIKMNTVYFAQHSIPQAIDYERMTIWVILIRTLTIYIVNGRNGEKKCGTKDRWRKNTQTGMGFTIRVLVKSWKKSVEIR